MITNTASFLALIVFSVLIATYLGVTATDRKIRRLYRLLSVGPMTLREIWDHVGGYPLHLESELRNAIIFEFKDGKWQVKE